MSSRLSLNTKISKPPSTSQKRVSAPPKVSSVAGGSRKSHSAPTSPVSRKSSGGGLPAASCSITTPPALPSRGGSAMPEGEILLPENMVFSAKTCLELLPTLSHEQLNFELCHFRAMGCKFDFKTRSGQMSDNQIISDLSEILSQKVCEQYEKSLHKFNTFFTSVSCLTKEAEDLLDKIRRPLAAESAANELSPDLVSQDIPTEVFTNEVFALNTSVNFDDMNVPDIVNDISFKQRVSCGRKVSFYGNTNYKYGSVNHEAMPYTDCPTFNTLFDRLSEIDPDITRDTYTCLATYYPNGRSYIPQHNDEQQIVPGSQIYTVSVGVPRKIRLVNKVGILNEKVFEVPHGSVYSMSADSQSTWTHGIDPEPPIEQPRISFTFRQLQPLTQNPVSFSAPPIAMPRPELPNVAKGSHQRILFLSDSIFSSARTHVFSRIPGHRCIKKTNYQLVDIFNFEPEFAYSSIVVISCGLNDLSRYGKRAHVLADLVARRLAECCRKHPNTTFVFNSILSTSFGWLNEEIAEFNRIMFELSLELDNMLFFDSHAILIDSPMRRTGVLETRKDYGANGCHITQAAKRLVIDELVRALAFRSDITSGRTPRRYVWPLRPAYYEMYYRVCGNWEVN